MGASKLVASEVFEGPVEVVYDFGLTFFAAHESPRPAILHDWAEHEEPMRRLANQWALAKA